MKQKAARRSCLETVVTFDKNGQPKGSSNIAYRPSDSDYEALNYVGERWKKWHDKKNKKRADAVVERIAR